MNRRIRQGLLLLASVVFVVATPLIVLYALGFRLTRERVGVLIVDSLPPRADVFVGGERLGITPQTISGRGGTSVLVTVRKPGYRDWEKRLPFITGVTSEVGAVILIPEQVPVRTLISNAHQFAIAPNRNLVAAVDARAALTIIDTEGRDVLPALPLPRLPLSLLWSPDSTAVAALHTSGQLDIISLADATRRRLSLPALYSPDALAWDPRLPGRLLLILKNGELLAVNRAGELEAPLALHVIDFAVNEKQIIALTEQSVLFLAQAAEANPERTLSLPKPAREILLGADQSVIIWFQDGSVSRLEADILVPITGSATSLGLSPSGDLLYLQTAPSELMVYNISNERLAHIPLRRLYLVTRLSKPITHPEWFAGGQHLIYQLGDQIVITEIDTRDRANSEVIDSTNLSNAHVAVGPAGESLFYLKKQDDSVSLVRADLVIP